MIQDVHPTRIRTFILENDCRKCYRVTTLLRQEFGYPTIVAQGRALYDHKAGHTIYEEAKHEQALD